MVGYFASFNLNVDVVVIKSSDCANLQLLSMTYPGSKKTIEKLFDGSSAQYSGLLPKDIIVQVDGRNVKSVPELQEIIGRAKVGDAIKLMINRRGEEMEILVRLKAADDE